MTKNSETDGILDIPADDQEKVIIAADESVDEEVGVLTEAITVQDEEPKKDKKQCFLSQITMDNWVIICSLLGIAFQFLAVMLLGIADSYVVYQVFAYLGYLSIIAGATIYVVQMLRTKTIAFTPQLVILILAIVMSNPLGII